MVAVTEQNREPSNIEQSQGNFGIGVMTGGTIESGAVVAGQYNVINQPKTPKPIPSNVRQGSNNFVERDGEKAVTVANIHEKLQSAQGVIVCAVEGMGGVGKTELSLQYAAHYKSEYKAQYFLSLREKGLAQAMVSFASPYIDLPEALQAETLEQQADWYWCNWLPDQGELLVILDDVPNAASIPELAMPSEPRIKVLVTTRQRELNLQFESLSLDVLSEAKAIALLENIVGKAKVAKEIDIVKQICSTLGCLPLGLELIGEYLRQNRFLSFADLQERLTLADESLSRDRAGLIYGQRGVAAAIQLSWDELSEASQRVAMWLGLFAPVDISWDLVASLGDKVALNDAELNQARGELDRLHLIKPVEEDFDFYTVHALVREFCQIKLSEAEENQPYRQGFVIGLLDIAKSMPSSPILEKIREVTPAIPHLELLSREMLDDIPNHDEDLIWAFIGTARFYEGQGFYALAEEPNQRCLEATQKMLGDRHPDVATSMNNLALLYSSQGKYEAAEPLYVQALELWQELLGERHPDVAT
ncbi:NB-ARC domain protein [[Leptolyngbya] sp. PCC 7376]|uniref:tetratricopeptide repeat protein n=1 Tax=[Leptolyngbya] sp. PCC 7376 TaxID=111781 RepID=UPI00029EFD41|nr:tetratricopeptide repeat protein [[Leptolyngbya] sp. PCC 7376]AFY39357.1 NB-ARC domain protein [[Leptolyngbya] sp. PCC 7376]